jgi:hypothetical protein
MKVVELHHDQGRRRVVDRPQSADDPGGACLQKGSWQADELIRGALKIEDSGFAP